jgi:hypothetical protein
MEKTSGHVARVRPARAGALLCSLLLAVAVPACASPGLDDGADATEDDLVATFDRAGRIDLQKRSHVLLVGDSAHLGDLPLWAATTRARRIAQLHPNDQIVLFVTKDATSADLTKAGATAVAQEPFGNVALADLRRLSADKLVAALDRFARIASISFYGHSSPFGELLEPDGDGRSLAAGMPANMGVLKDNFDRDANPYITLNGCNGGAHVAPELSRLFGVPVSAALTGTMFQILMSDGRWYFDDAALKPDGLTAQSSNTASFGASSHPSCSAGACTRMKPQDSPYSGVWANPDTGFQYGLNYYKFFCDFADSVACTKGMIESLYTFPSVRPIDATSSEDEVKQVLADVFCTGEKDASWFDSCAEKLAAAAASNASFSPMKGANDWSLECSFTGCDEKLRCATVDGVPQQKSCVWVSGACGESQSASSCRPKNTQKHTTVTEYRRYLDGHSLMHGG